VTVNVVDACVPPTTSENEEIVAPFEVIVKAPDPPALLGTT